MVKRGTLIAAGLSFLLACVFCALGVYLVCQVDYWSVSGAIEPGNRWLTQFLQAIDDSTRRNFDITAQVGLAELAVALVKICMALSIYAWFIAAPAKFMVWRPAIFSVAVLLVALPFLQSPPFGDAMTSYFSEGFWLANHGFDYFEFARQPSWGSGGPVTYFISLYSFMIGLTFRFINDTSIFLALHHLLSVTAAAISLNIAFKLFARQFDEHIALLGVLMVFVTPYFGEEIVQLNSDIYLLCLWLLALSCFIDNRIKCSVFWVTVLVCTKAAGLIWATVLLMVAVAKTLVDRRIDATRILMTLPFLLQLLIVYLTRKAFESKAPLTDALMDYYHIAANIRFTFFQSSVVSVLVWIAVLYTMVQLIRRYSPVIRRSWTVIASQEFLQPIVLINICLLGWILMFMLLLRSGSSPRYLVMIWPLLIFDLLYFLQLRYGAKVIQDLFLVFVVCGPFALGFKHYGAPQVAPFYVRLEQDLARYVETHYEDHAILTGRPLVQVLALPELGFVSQRINIITMSDTRVSSIADTALESEMREWPENYLIAYGTHILHPQRHAFNPQSHKLLQQFKLRDTSISLYHPSGQTSANH